MSATSLKVSRSSVSDMSLGNQTNMGMLLGVLFLVMALLQLVGLSGLKDWLAAIGFTSEASWAAIIIIVEIIAALGFFKLALSPMVKTLTWACALVASGFWFIENVRLISVGTTSQLTSSGFFGKYLQQSPGWWTVIEVTILLFWTLYALGIDKEK